MKEKSIVKTAIGGFIVAGILASLGPAPNQNSQNTSEDTEIRLSTGNNSWDAPVRINITEEGFPTSRVVMPSSSSVILINQKSKNTQVFYNSKHSTINTSNQKEFDINGTATFRLDGLHKTDKLNIRT
jgi:hypothetical protein